MIPTWNTVLAIALGAAVFVPPAFAEQGASGPSGVARTAESGGTRPGCVAYTSNWLDRPGKRPDRKLIFDMENRCDRPVWIRLAYQTDLSASPGGIRLLKAGERLAGDGKTHNYIIVYPTTPHLRFWLWQHDAQPEKQPSFHNCHQKASNDPKWQPCPPGVTVFGSFR